MGIFRSVGRWVHRYVYYVYTCIYSWGGDLKKFPRGGRKEKGKGEGREGERLFCWGGEERR